MDITKTVSGTDVVLSLSGRLDTTTSMQLADVVEGIFAEGAFNLLLDLDELEYMSSAGLRVLLIAQKHAAAKGTHFALAGVKGAVKEVLDITGFSGMLNIQ